MAARRLLSWQGRRDARILVAVALGCYFGALLLSNAVTSEFDLWRYFGVLNISGPFEDMRVITSGWECTRRGYDVLAENPCDPFNRETNYPRIWMSLAALGLGQSSTVALALAVWAAFFAAVFSLIGRLTRGEALVYTAALVSPSVMLGVASANNDLVVFALIVLALAAVRARRKVVRAGSYGLFLLAAVLKLYPAFAFTVLLRQGGRRAVVGLAATALPMAAYLYATRDDLHLISAATPRPVSLAYGAGVLLDGVRERLAGVVPGVDVLDRGAGYAIAYALFLGVALVLALWMARRLHPTPRRDRVAASAAWRLDAFWAGASIYIGTFVLGHNWDYRLVFLLLTIPQLSAWVREEDRPVPLPSWVLVGVIATLWLSRLPFIFPLDDVLNACLFIYFTAALVATAPAGLARPFRRVYKPRSPRRAPQGAIGS